VRSKRGNPGLGAGDKVNFAAACAAADFLPEKDVAGIIGMKLGAFKSKRKAFRAGGRGSQAREAYHCLRQMFQDLNPKELRGLLSKTRK